LWAPSLEGQEGLPERAPEIETAVGERITLDDAIERAIERSPSFAQSQASFANAQQDNRESFGSFLPSLSASAGSSISSTRRFDPNTDVIVSGSANSYSAGLNASVGLFEGGRRFSDRARTQASLESAMAGLEDQRFQVRLETKQLFFAALEQSELVDVARSRVEQALQSLELVRRRAELGVATTSDSLRARLEWVNAQQNVLQAETTAKAARFALGRHVGVAGPVVPVPPDDLDPSPLGLTRDDAIAVAQASSPSVLASRASAAASSASVGMAKAAWLPSLRMSGNYSWNNGDFSLADGQTSWSVRLSASYPLFNGFSRESSIVRAQENERVAQMQAQDRQLAARQQTDAALDILRTSEEAIVIAQEAVAVAQEDLRVVRERYRLGVATILDLVASQIALDQAGTDLVTARYNYLLARAQLEAILGREL
jgi:outer membrane protein TolC